MKKRALISCYKKEGIVEFVKELVNKFNFEIISTGGTAELLKKNLIPVTEVSQITDFPEILNGRVKTLHPAIHGGLLARRNKKEDINTISKYNIEPIDLLVIDLYPFEEIVAKENTPQEEIIEMIDIGGPSMIRSAAKNFSFVTVICDTKDYKTVLDELTKNNGDTSLVFREKLAEKAFKKTCCYDQAIANFFTNLNTHKTKNKQERNGSSFPETLTINLKLKKHLRYGENPHQRGALYTEEASNYGLANAEVIQGKELSFNNYLDLNSAWNIACEFDSNTPIAVIVKHNNPCSVAIGPTLFHAYVEAYNRDPISAFGGIVAFNNTVDEDIAKELTKTFLEAIVAPNFTPTALETLKSKPNLRVLKVNQSNSCQEKLDIKNIGDGFLLQDSNHQTIDTNKLNFVTKRKPTESEVKDLIFAWKICKHVKSNAIIVAKDGKTVGVGAGQTNRIGAVEIAINQANYNTKNAVLASEAFFPFKDSIEIAASAKISAIIQPGGSIKDKEIIEACDKYNIAMVFTGIRHFRH